MEKLKELRRIAVMSREELAEEAGIHYETLRRIETGSQEPRAKTIRKLAGALGVEPQQLLKEGGDA